MGSNCGKDERAQGWQSPFVRYQHIMILRSRDPGSAWVTPLRICICICICLCICICHITYYSHPSKKICLVLPFLCPWLASLKTGNRMLPLRILRTWGIDTLFRLRLVHMAVVLLWTRAYPCASRAMGRTLTCNFTSVSWSACTLLISCKRLETSGNRGMYTGMYACTPYTQ